MLLVVFSFATAMGAQVDVLTLVDDRLVWGSNFFANRGVGVNPWLYKQVGS